MNKSYIRQSIKDQGLIPLFYHPDKNTCIDTVKALYAAGVRIIEFTNRGENAPEIFKALIKEREKSMNGLMLAIGTIRNSSQASEFIKIGADFLISPVFDNNICNTCRSENILWIPGCMTPTEIHQAEMAGCQILKLFPGNLLGPSFIEAINPLFPGLEYVITGGVDTSPSNLKSWFDTGIAGVGMGSKLITKQILENKNFDQLTQKTIDLISAIKKIKTQP